MMTGWEAVANNPERTALDETHVCKIDNLIRNQAEALDAAREELAALRPLVADLDADNAKLRAKLSRAHALNALLLLVGAGGVVVACHPW